MTKRDFCKLIAEKNSVTLDTASGVYDTIFNTIREEVSAGNTVTITGFGVFKTKVLKARNGINPAKKTKIAIPERKKLGFRASKTL